MMRKLILTICFAILCIDSFEQNTIFSSVIKVKKIKELSSSSSNFNGIIQDYNKLGKGLASIGDLDGDGVMDMAVGAYGTNDGGDSHGALWILFMNKDGSVKRQQKISQTSGNFLGKISDTGEFGLSVISLGDVDGDGVYDLAVGVPRDDDGGARNGSVWILFLKKDGTVKNQQKISQNSGNLNEILDDDVRFGQDVAGIGDLNKDGIPDLAVGTYGYSDGGYRNGAIFVLFLNRDGTIKFHQKISSTQGNFKGILHDNDFFGCAVAGLSDFDNDGNADIIVGAHWDNDGGQNHGAAWILYLNRDGTVKNYNKISSTSGNFKGVLKTGDLFGSAVFAIGDVNCDGITDIAVGARNNNDGTGMKGAVWILCLNKDGTVKEAFKISDTQGNFNNILENGNGFGWAIANLADFNDDGYKEIAIGAPGYNGNGLVRGAVFILSLIQTPGISDSIVNLKCNNDGKIYLGNTAKTCFSNLFSIDNAKTFHTDSIFDDLSAGKYIISVKNNLDTFFIDTIVLSQTIPYQIRFVSDTINFISNNGTISCTVSGGSPPYTYVWSVSSENNSTISFKSANSKYVYISVYDANKCLTYDSVYIKINEECNTWLPNAFTPNGDGINDTYEFFGCNIIDFKMLIFNRWGACIFDSRNVEIGWDGKFNGNDCPVGVYFCIVSYSNYQNIKNTKMSSVALLR